MGVSSVLLCVFCLVSVSKVSECLENKKIRRLSLFWVTDLKRTTRYSAYFTPSFDFIIFCEITKIVRVWNKQKVNKEENKFNSM